MNRTQMACYALLASAFALTGLLLYSAPERLEPAANASMVVGRENFTLMTARTRNDDESLFVLENASQKLLIYSVDIGHHRLEPVGFADLASGSVPGPGGGKIPR